MSRLNVTVPGTVFTLPGVRERIPVLARAAYLAARVWERRISLAAVRRASERWGRAVVPRRY